MEGIARRALMTSARATSRLHRPRQFWQARRLIVLAASYELQVLSPCDDERLRLPLSRISTIRTRHALPTQVAMSNDYSRFPVTIIQHYVKTPLNVTTVITNNARRLINQVYLSFPSTFHYH